jgi:glycosyltransferase involved in cell wall biosynthesis
MNLLEGVLKQLTIAVPSYNVEKTLEATLASLCIDELLPFLDIVVVNDGSKDGTAGIAAAFCERYPDSVRLIHKQNGGHGSAVNTGIDAARGRYFKVVDGDDRLDRAGLSALITALQKSESDLVATNYKKVLPDGSEAGDMDFSGVSYNTVYPFEQLPTDGSIYFGIHSSTFKTEILKKNVIRLQEHTFYVDTEYALLPIPFIHTVEILPERVYLYTVGSAQQSIDTANFVRRYDDHLRVVTRLAAFAAGCGADGPHGDYIYSVLAKLCFTQYMLAAFYDENATRGRQRARRFDKWLKGDKRLYTLLSKSVYIRFMRITRFTVLPRGTRLKKGARAFFGAVKRVTGKKKLTY